MPASRKPADLLTLEKAIAKAYDVPLAAVTDLKDGQLLAQARAREERRMFKREIRALMARYAPDNPVGS